MPTIRQIVENSDSISGKVFDYGIQILIVVSLVAFSIETLPDLKPATRAILRGIEVFTIALFTIEYVIRVYVSRNRWKFITSFFGVMDLLAILPFYLSTGLDLRSLRVCRLFRLFRILKLARYSKAMQRFHKAVLIAKEEVVLFIVVTMLLIYLASVGIYFFENPAQPDTFKSVFHSMWWAVSTLTTVGYGDVYPITAGGKIFTVFILLIGLGIVSVPAGLVASALSRARELETEEVKSRVSDAADNADEQNRNN